MSNDNQPKILLYDIETAPNLAYVWAKYQQDVIAYEEEWTMLSFAHKWLGERKTYCHTVEDMSEKALLRELWSLFDEADIVIAHNGDAFDQKKSNARLLYHEFPPPTPYRSIDTLKVARRYFKFNSNRLDDLGKLLGIGSKVAHTGFALWKGCMEGDRAAWRKMVRYNKRDIQLLEDVYLRMRPWIDGHPSVAAPGRPSACPKCGSGKFKSHGWRTNKTTRYRQYLCKRCGGFFRDRQADKSFKVDVVN